MSVSTKQLYRANGKPRKGLYNAMAHFTGAANNDIVSPSLETLKSWADKGEIQPWNIFRLKGNGNPAQPGLLAQYLFGLPSKEDRERDWTDWQI